jgi:adenosylcobinamide kinase/adenosylcobinamide-phosphate guanylyltransferase
MPLILIGGGSRSGKSSHALEVARERGARRAFIATAQAFDAEMTDRIRRHREERDPSFETFEEPTNVSAVIREIGSRYDSLVVDCLTLWLSNLMLAEREDIDEAMDDLVAAAQASPAACILVTNEVGCGIVPDNALARRFRDLAGTLNQRCGRVAAEAYLMAFGFTVRLK